VVEAEDSGSLMDIDNVLGPDSTLIGAPPDYPPHDDPLAGARRVLPKHLKLGAGTRRRAGSSHRVT